MRTYSGRSVGVLSSKRARQDTVNHEIEQVNITCGSAYIARITDSVASYGDACTIGIFLLRSDLTHNHGVENFLLSFARYIFKANYAESFVPSTCCFLGPFDLLPTPWHIGSSSLA